MFFKKLRCLPFIVAVACIAAATMRDATAAELPEDGNKYQLIFVDSPADVMQWFREHKTLNQLAFRCKVIQYKSTDVLFRSRYSRAMPTGSAPPAFLFARGDSGVLYVATRDTMPTSADQLYRELKDAYRLAGEDTYAASIDAQPGKQWRPGDRIRESREKLTGIRLAIDQLTEAAGRLHESSWLVNAIAAGLAIFIVNLLTAPKVRT